MNGHRYRWGGLAWLLTLQFFVVEAIVALQYDGYSYSANVISDLGTAASPAAALMNVSFVVQGVLIVAGTLLLGPALLGTGGRVARFLLLVAGLGVALVGVFSSDSSSTLHEVAAGAYFLAGAIGVIALAYAVRPRSEGLGTTLAALGLLGVVGTVFFGAAVFLFLGEGGMERVAGYVLPIALPLAGVVLWRQGDWTARRDGAPSRQELREAERAERALRAAERDAALEAAAARAAGQRAGATAVAPQAGGTPSADGDDEPDDFDPDDPWAPRRRS